MDYPKEKIVIPNQPCRLCSSSDARQVYESGSSFCFSCKSYFSKTGKRFDMPTPTLYKRQDIAIEDIKGLQSRELRARGISKYVCEFFGVKTALDADGEIAIHYYPYENGYKRRKLPKEFSWIGHSGGVFGKEAFPGANRRLVITEGEIDALSVAEAAYRKYDKIYPVIGLSSSSATRELLHIRDWIRNYEEVVLCFDEDDAGQKAVAEAARIVGYDKARVARLPLNDANEVLLKRSSIELLNCIFNATRFVPSGIICKDDIWAALEKYNQIESVPYPPCLSGLNEKLKGMRYGDIALYISGTGCFGKGTKVYKTDGTLVCVEDVVVGDLLLGPDNTPREVQKLFRGTEQMVLVTLRDKSYFVCNESHVLSLVNNDNEGRWGLKQNEIVDVTVSDYREWSAKRKHLSKSYKMGHMIFDELDFELPIDPYVLGVWLGDGSSIGCIFSCCDEDSAIIDKIREKGYYIYKGASKFAWNAPGRIREELTALGVHGNKHIPEIYLCASIEDRLELLAGLLDTDGSYDSLRHGYEFSQKKEHIVLAVKRLAETLGFTTFLGKQQNNKFGNCFRLFISGEGLEQIPCVLPRKQARVRKQIKDPRRYAFTITPLDVDEYYGFEVDGDHRFILENGIVTHNSGKSSLIREIIYHLLQTTTDTIGIVALEESPAETARKLSSLVLNKNSAKEEIPLEELKIGFDKIFGDDRVVLLDHQGAISDNGIVDQLEYMALTGCKYIFIDHITILVSEGVEGLSGNESQDKMMNSLLKLVKRHNVHIGLVSHLRKTPNQSKSFEEGKLPNLDSIRGSGSVKQISMDVIGFSRDMTSNDENVRNRINMAVLKCRHTGLTGEVTGCTYDFNTGRLFKNADEFHAID